MKNKDINLMLIEAVRIKDRKTYGFWEGELNEFKKIMKGDIN